MGIIDKTHAGDVHIIIISSLRINAGQNFQHPFDFIGVKIKADQRITHGRVPVHPAAQGNSAEQIAHSNKTGSAGHQMIPDDTVELQGDSGAARRVNFIDVPAHGIGNKIPQRRLFIGNFQIPLRARQNLVITQVEAGQEQFVNFVFKVIDCFLDFFVAQNGAVHRYDLVMLKLHFSVPERNVQNTHVPAVSARLDNNRFAEDNRFFQQVVRTAADDNIDSPDLAGENLVF